MRNEKRLSDIGEEGAWTVMRPYVARDGGAVLCGAGDDGAVVGAPAGMVLVATADALVEGVHFLAGMNWRGIGRKAMAANLSDLAAMGAAPAHALVSVGLPGDFLVSDLRDLYRGMHGEAKRYGAAIVGGDTVRSPVAFVNVALWGWAKRRRGPGAGLPLRSNCRAGMRLYVTGTLGDSGAGLDLLLGKVKGKGKTVEGKKLAGMNPAGKKLAGKKPAGGPVPHIHVEAALVRRHLAPTPRVEAGLALAAGFADLAMIDVSDGLMREARLLAEASGARVVVDAARVPLSRALRAFGAAVAAGGDGVAEALKYALRGGEDYELLFATHAELDAVREVLRGAGVKVKVTEIGRIEQGRAKFVLESGGGLELGLGELEGFSHFG